MPDIKWIWRHYLLLFKKKYSVCIETFTKSCIQLQQTYLYNPAPNLDCVFGYNNHTVCDIAQSDLALKPPETISCSQYNTVVH